MTALPPTTPESLLQRTVHMLRSQLADEREAFIGAKMSWLGDRPVLITDWHIHSVKVPQTWLQIRSVLDPADLAAGDYDEMWHDLDYQVSYETYAGPDATVEVIEGKPTLVVEQKWYHEPSSSRPLPATFEGPV